MRKPSPPCSSLPLGPSPEILLYPSLRSVTCLSYVGQALPHLIKSLQPWPIQETQALILQAFLPHTFFFFFCIPVASLFSTSICDLKYIYIHICFLCVDFADISLLPVYSVCTFPISGCFCKSFLGGFSPSCGSLSL